MIGFLEGVLIFIGVIYLLRKIAPYFLKRMLRKAMERQQASGNPFQNSSFYNQNNKSNINQSHKNHPSMKSNEGEFVDYEEIK